MRYVIAVLCLLLVGCSHEPPPYVSTYTSPPPYTDPGRPPFDAVTVSQALRSNQPYVISVLGDSTGNNRGEWVHLVSERIARVFNRPVMVHDWNIDTNAYATDTTYPGAGAPVTVWNGSGAGKPAQYSAQWYPQMAPQPVNLTFVNHSHNRTRDAVPGVEHLVDTAYANTLPGGGVVVILQNPRTDDRADAGQQAIDELRGVYSVPKTGVVLVDVNSAFTRGDVPALLRPDGVHPNEQGSQVWADTVVNALRLG